MLICVDFSVKEDIFWRNYFYRVSLIKQSAQLTALAAQAAEKSEEVKSSTIPEDNHKTGSITSVTCIILNISIYIFLFILANILQLSSTYIL